MLHLEMFKPLKILVLHLFICGKLTPYLNKEMFDLLSSRVYSWLFVGQLVPDLEKEIFICLKLLVCLFVGF
jgi:hypothetical protein